MFLVNLLCDDGKGVGAVPYSRQPLSTINKSQFCFYLCTPISGF
jgi:hypothetical protein